MLFNTQAILAFSSFVLFANAQDSTTTTDTAALPTSTDGITPCILTCVTGAASSAGCSSFADLQCVCTNEAFQSAAQACLQSTCTADEQAAALQLQQSQCADVFPSTSGTATGTTTSGTATGTTTTASTSTSGSVTATVPATGTTTRATTTSSSSHTGTTTSTSAAATSTQPNSASGLKVGFADGSLVGAVLALSGALAGALLVL